MNARDPRLFYFLTSEMPLSKCVPLSVSGMKMRSINALRPRMSLWDSRR